MTTSFIIATLIIFVLNLFLNLVSLALQSSNGKVNSVSVFAIFLSLVMITWNIFAIIYR